LFTCFGFPHVKFQIIKSLCIVYMFNVKRKNNKNYWVVQSIVRGHHNIILTGFSANRISVLRNRKIIVVRFFPQFHAILTENVRIILSRKLSPSPPPPPLCFFPSLRSATAALYHTTLVSFGSTLITRPRGCLSVGVSLAIFASAIYDWIGSYTPTLKSARVRRSSVVFGRIARTVRRVSRPVL